MIKQSWGLKNAKPEFLTTLLMLNVDKKYSISERTMKTVILTKLSYFIKQSFRFSCPGFILLVLQQISQMFKNLDKTFTLFLFVLIDMSV